MNLFKHQEEGIDFLLNAGRACLFDDTGLGKTLQTLIALDLQNCQRILIVASKTPTYNWANEIRQWLPGSSVIIVDGKSEQAREIQLLAGARFTVINYSLLTTQDEWSVNKVTGKRFKTGKVQQRHVPTLLGIQWDALVFDESHRIRNRDSKAFDTAKKMARKGEKDNIPLFCLSGTPIYNKADDIWTNLHLINRLKFGSFWNFVDSHCPRVYTTWNPYGEPGPVKDPEKLKAEISPYILRRVKSECLDLPPVTVVQLDIDLDDKQRVAYKSMKKSMFLEWGGRTVEAINAVAQLTRLKQLCVSGDLFNDSNLLRGGKIEALKDILEDLNGQKAIICSQFATFVNRAVPIFSKGHSPVFFTGKTSARGRQEAIDAFNNDPRTDLLFTTIQCGEGYNAVGGSVCIFLDYCWAPPTNYQLISRLNRIGQTRNITVYNLVARNTVEQKILRLLGKKEAIFDSVLSEQSVMSIIEQALTEDDDSW